MSGEMIAIIAATIALAAVLVPGQRGMRNDIKNLLSKTSGLEKRLDGVEERLDGVEERFGSLEREVATVRTEVARVETRLVSRIGKLEAELKERLARLEGYFEAMGVGDRPLRNRAAK